MDLQVHIQRNRMVQIRCLNGDGHLIALVMEDDQQAEVVAAICAALRELPYEERAPREL